MRFARLLKRPLPILIVIYLTYSLILAFFSHRGFPQAMSVDSIMPYLADKPVGEDAFYILTVAWNLADKYTISYNYDQLTTGIQPLVTFIYAIFAWVVQLLGGDKWIFIRIVIIYNVFILLTLAHVLGSIAKKLIPNDENEKYQVYFLTFIITIFNFGLFSLVTYGLETGTYLLFIATSCWYTLRFTNNRKLALREAIVFGTLTGLTGLLRIDFGIILLGFLICLTLHQRVTVRIRWSLLVGFTAFFIVIPWFIWVYYVTGQVMPSSGLAEARLIDLADLSGRFRVVLIEIISLLTLNLIIAERLRILVAFAFFLIIFIFFFRKNHYFRSLLILDSRKKQYIFYWVLALVPLIFIYPVFFQSTWFYKRYFSPLLIVYLPILAIALHRLLQNKPRRFRVASLLIFIMCFFIGAILSFHSGRITHTQAVAAGFAKENFPPCFKIGALQTGILGFFNNNVINLDGKMNYDIHKLEINKESLTTYLDRENIDVIIDWEIFIWWEFLYPEDKKARFLANWKGYPHKIPDGMTVCFVRRQTHNCQNFPRYH